MYDGKQEYDYKEELGFVDLPGVFTKLKSNDFEEKLLYQDRDNKSIIKYIKALKYDE